MKTNWDLLAGRSLQIDAAKEQGYKELRKAVPVLGLLIGETTGLSMAGVVVPSWLRSVFATHQASALGSLHTLTIAHITLTYKFADLGFAMLGALCGAGIALALDPPVLIADAVRTILTFRWASFEASKISPFRPPKPEPVSNTLLSGWSSRHGGGVCAPVRDC